MAFLGKLGSKLKNIPWGSALDVLSIGVELPGLLGGGSEGTQEASNPPVQRDAKEEEEEALRLLRDLTSLGELTDAL